MRDLIDREAALACFHDWVDAHGDVHSADEMIEYQRIEALPSVGGWIPCTERMPDKDGDYLVTFEHGYRDDYGLDPIGIAPFEVDCEGFGFWQEQFDRVSLGSLGSDWVDINVVAWMPLPEPAREEDADE